MLFSVDSLLDFRARRSVMGDKGKHELPGRRCLWALFLWFKALKNSTKVQPRDHMSIAWSYCFSHRIISGERYHLDYTWFDRLLFLDTLLDYFATSLSAIIYLNFNSWDVSVILALKKESLTRFEFPLPWPTQLLGSVLASPKSQILTLNSLSISIFEGLMSLWIILAECRNFIAETQLKNMSSDWTLVKSLKFREEFPPMKLLRSVSKYSITMKTPNYWLSGALKISSILVVKLFPGICERFCRIYISLTTLT